MHKVDELKALLKEAEELFELWLDPMKVPCSASGHQRTPERSFVVSCTCRENEIRRRTVEFLRGHLR